MRQWNANMEERRKVVGTKTKRSRSLDEAARGKAGLQNLIRQSQTQMWSDSLQKVRGAIVWRVAQYNNHQVGRTVEALTDREGKQANTAAGKEEIVRHKSFPRKDNDQYFDLPAVGSAHTRVTT
jgi:hypothetical protein